MISDLCTAMPPHPRIPYTSITNTATSQPQVAPNHDSRSPASPSPQSRTLHTSLPTYYTLTPVTSTSQTLQPQSHQYPLDQRTNTPCLRDLPALPPPFQKFFSPSQGRQELVSWEPWLTQVIRPRKPPYLFPRIHSTPCLPPLSPRGLSPEPCPRKPQAALASG